MWIAGNRLGSRRERTAKVRLYIAFFALPTLCLINVVTLSLASGFYDLTGVLDWKYIGLWPMNFNYITTLRGFNISDNTIAYITLSTSNTVLFCIIFIALTTIIFAYKAIKYDSNYRMADPAAQKMPLSAIGVFLFILPYLVIVDFEDSYSLYRLSIYRPFILALLVLHFVIIATAFLVSAIITVLIEKTIFTWKQS